MNHHAEKLVVAASRAGEAAMDRALGDVLSEVYECPACGTSAWRREEAG
jgi:hypothetical protein